VTCVAVSGGGGPPYAGAGTPALHAPTPIALASTAPNSSALRSLAIGASVLDATYWIFELQNGHALSVCFTWRAHVGQGMNDTSLLYAMNGRGTPLDAAGTYGGSFQCLCACFLSCLAFEQTQAGPQGHLPSQEQPFFSQVQPFSAQPVHLQD
jgi:hypothetical protein